MFQPILCITLQSMDKKYWQPNHIVYTMIHQTAGNYNLAYVIFSTKKGQKKGISDGVPFFS